MLGAQLAQSTEMKPTTSGAMPNRETVMTPVLAIRVVLWLAVWAAALAVTVSPFFSRGMDREGQLMVLSLVPFFAEGLFFFLAGTPAGMFGLAAGWIVYLYLTVILFTTPSAARYWKVFALLCALLAVNVAGCSHLLRQVKLS